MLAGIDIGGQVFGDITIEHGAEDIILEIPAIHRAAKLIRDGPDCAMYLIPFLVSLQISSHGLFLRFIISVFDGSGIYAKGSQNMLQP